MAYVLPAGYCKYGNKPTYATQQVGLLQFRRDYSLQINACAPRWLLAISLIKREGDRGR